MIHSIRFFNRESAQKWVAVPDEALVSIYGKGEEKPSMEHEWDFLLSLQFDDADESKEDRLLFTLDQAKQIVEFVKNAEEDGAEYLFVHCKGGISRSAAVAMALGEYYNVKVFMGYRLLPESYSQYNKFVYRKVREALYGPEFGFTS